MIYMTFERSSLQCISVRFKNLLPLMLFKKLVAACPTFGFLVLALTAIPMNGAAILTAGLRILFQAACVPLKIF